MATYRTDPELVKANGKTVKRVVLVEGHGYEDAPALHFTDGTILTFNAQWRPDDAWVDWEWSESDGHLPD